MAPISFTKTITLSCKTSVASVKFLMSQKPNIAITFCPGNIGLMCLPSLIFDVIILDPASPNPRASSLPILVKVFSSAVVSRFNCFSFASLFYLSSSSSAIYIFSSS